MTMAARTMKLKSKPNSKMWDLKSREVSARRQVGDAESTVNQPTAGESATPWWKSVGMDEM